MRARSLFVLLVLLIGACGGSDGTVAGGAEASGSDLSGVSFDVHQEPG